MTRSYGRTHDGRGFVIYTHYKPPGPYIKSYTKDVLDRADAEEMHAALTVYLREQEASMWAPVETE